MMVAQSSPFSMTQAHGPDRQKPLRPQTPEAFSAHSSGTPNACLNWHCIRCSPLGDWPTARLHGCRQGGPEHRPYQKCFPGDSHPIEREHERRRSERPCTRSHRPGPRALMPAICCRRRGCACCAQRELAAPSFSGGNLGIRPHTSNTTEVLHRHSAPEE